MQIANAPITPPKLAARIAIIEARFYGELCDEMAKGAMSVIADAGASYERIAVPGALEIPVAARIAMDAGFDGVVAIGCVIRGETSHYDIVCNESARGLTDLATQFAFPAGNAVLTVENMAQAEERADCARGNKGGWAADACLRMIALKRHYVKNQG
jgi:6,7-dimethyl-8-ribityllumazine synthase